MYVCIHTYICMYMCDIVCIHICVHVYMHMCMYMCACVYIYVYFHMSLFLFEAHNSGSPLELNIKKRFHWLLWEQAACAYEASL